MLKQSSFFLEGDDVDKGNFIKKVKTQVIISAKEYTLHYYEEKVNTVNRYTIVYRYETKFGEKRLLIFTNHFDDFKQAEAPMFLLDYIDELVEQVEYPHLNRLNKYEALAILCIKYPKVILDGIELYS